MNPGYLEIRSFHCAGLDFIPDVGSMGGSICVYIYVHYGEWFLLGGWWLNPKP